jgi:hypothetical protein
MKWLVYVASTEKTRTAYIINGNPKGKRQRRFGDNIKMRLD